MPQDNLEFRINVMLSGRGLKEFKRQVDQIGPKMDMVRANVTGTNKAFAKMGRHIVTSTEKVVTMNGQVMTQQQAVKAVLGEQASYFKGINQQAKQLAVATAEEEKLLTVNSEQLRNIAGLKNKIVVSEREMLHTIKGQKGVYKGIRGFYADQINDQGKIIGTMKLQKDQYQDLVRIAGGADDQLADIQNHIDKAERSTTRLVNTTRRFRFEYLGIMFAGMALARAMDRWLQQATEAYKEIYGEMGPYLARQKQIEERQKRLRAETIKNARASHWFNEQILNIQESMSGSGMNEFMGVLRQLAGGLGNFLQVTGQIVLAVVSLKIALGEINDMRYRSKQAAQAEAQALNALRITISDLDASRHNQRDSLSKYMLDSSRFTGILGQEGFMLEDNKNKVKEHTWALDEAGIAKKAYIMTTDEFAEVVKKSGMTVVQYNQVIKNLRDSYEGQTDATNKAKAAIFTYNRGLIEKTHGERESKQATDEHSNSMRGLATSASVASMALRSVATVLIFTASSAAVKFIDSQEKMSDSVKGFLKMVVRIASMIAPMLLWVSVLKKAEIQARKTTRANTFLGFSMSAVGKKALAAVPGVASLTFALKRLRDAILGISFSGILAGLTGISMPGLTGTLSVINESIIGAFSSMAGAITGFVGSIGSAASALALPVTAIIAAMSSLMVIRKWMEDVERGAKKFSRFWYMLGDSIRITLWPLEITVFLIEKLAQMLGLIDKKREIKLPIVAEGVMGVAKYIADYLKPGSDTKKGPLSDLSIWGKGISLELAKGMVRGRNFIADAGIITSKTFMKNVEGLLDIGASIRSSFAAPLNLQGETESDGILDWLYKLATGQEKADVEVEGEGGEEGINVPLIGEALGVLADIIPGSASFPANVALAASGAVWKWVTGGSRKGDVILNESDATGTVLSKIASGEKMPLDLDIQQLQELQELKGTIASIGANITVTTPGNITITDLSTEMASLVASLNDIPSQATVSILDNGDILFDNIAGHNLDIDKLRSLLESGFQGATATVNEDGSLLISGLPDDNRAIHNLIVSLRNLNTSGADVEVNETGNIEISQIPTLITNLIAAIDKLSPTYKSEIEALIKEGNKEAIEQFINYLDTEFPDDPREGQKGWWGATVGVITKVGEEVWNVVQQLSGAKKIIEIRGGELKIAADQWVNVIGLNSTIKGHLDRIGNYLSDIKDLKLKESIQAVESDVQDVYEKLIDITNWFATLKGVLVDIYARQDTKGDSIISGIKDPIVTAIGEISISDDVATITTKLDEVSVGIINSVDDTHGKLDNINTGVSSVNTSVGNVSTTMNTAIGGLQSTIIDRANYIANAVDVDVPTPKVTVNAPPAQVYIPHGLYVTDTGTSAVVNAINTASTDIINALGGVTGYQHGGIVPETGLYTLHAGEYVIPQHGAPVVTSGSGGNTYNITINLNASVANDVDVKMLSKKIGDEIKRDLERRMGVV